MDVGATPAGTFDVRRLGRVDYGEALTLQAALVEDRRAGRIGDTLLLLEHPPVITLGRSARREHVLVDDARREALGIELHESGRGGDVTYHAPGQLVGYPILALPEGRRDAHLYLRSLEDALILTAADYGVRAARREGLTGIWVGERKLAAIGVRIGTGWITSHGFALNVTTDHAGFETIVPCGLEDRGVTSLAELTGKRIPLREAAARIAARAGEVLGLEVVPAEDPAERLAPHAEDGLSS